MSGERHAWQLVAPWWAWPTADDPLTGRGTPPLLQKFAADEFVDGFLKRPQHSLRFDEFTDRVAAVTLLSKALPKAIARAQAAQSWLDGGADAERSENLPLDALVKNPRELRLVPSGPRKLFLPVHARHYLVSCELHCDAREFPSVDPAAVCRSGFVVRRLSSPVPRELERELFGLQQQREQAIAALNELLLRGPLRQHLDWLRRRKLEQLEARGELPAARAQAQADVAAAEAALVAWRARHGILQKVEVWHADASDPDVGDWVELASEAQLGVDADEYAFPLRRLHAPPTEPSHDAAGRTIFFGSVPTTSAQRDRAGRPRFDDRSLYEIRCFVTRRRADCPRPRGFAGCKGERVWSLATEPYRLAATMDAVGCANRPITIRMPDLNELLGQAVARPRGALSNVRVVHRQQIAPKGIDKSGSPGGAAICHFSIPLITIVAMFVLNIFLPIVVLLFQLWFLLALRFCIPPSFSLGAKFNLAAKITNLLPPSGSFAGGLSIDGVAKTEDEVRTALKESLDEVWSNDNGPQVAGKANALDDTALARDARNAVDNNQQPALAVDDEGRAIEPPLLSPSTPPHADYLDVPEPKHRRAVIKVRPA